MSYVLIVDPALRTRLTETQMSQSQSDPRHSRLRVFSTRRRWNLKIEREKRSVIYSLTRTPCIERRRARSSGRMTEVWETQRGNDVATTSDMWKLSAADAQPTDGRLSHNTRFWQYLAVNNRWERILSRTALRHHSWMHFLRANVTLWL